MKKFNKILAALLSVMIISASSALTIYADENEQSEKITDPDEIISLINAFVEEEEIPDCYVNNTVGVEADAGYKVVIWLDGDTEDNLFTTLISDFIKEKNIDDSIIVQYNGVMAKLYWFRDVNGDDKTDVR